MEHRKLAEKFIEAIKPIDDKLSGISDYLQNNSQMSDLSVIKKEIGRTTIEVCGLKFIIINTPFKIMGIYSPSKNYLDLANYNFSKALLLKIEEFILLEINKFISNI